jgi:hypothetical protein
MRVLQAPGLVQAVRIAAIMLKRSRFFRVKPNSHLKNHFNTKCLEKALSNPFLTEVDMNQRILAGIVPFASSMGFTSC